MSKVGRTSREEGEEDNNICPARFGNICATELIQMIEENGVHQHSAEDNRQIVNNMGAKLNQKENDIDAIYISHREKPQKNRATVGFFCCFQTFGKVPTC